MASPRTAEPRGGLGGRVMSSRRPPVRSAAAPARCDETDQKCGKGERPARAMSSTLAIAATAAATARGGGLAARGPRASGCATRTRVPSGARAAGTGRSGRAACAGATG